MTRKGFVMALLLVAIPCVSFGATIYTSNLLTDTSSGLGSGNYTLTIGDRGDGISTTYNATLSVDTNVVSNAYIDWFLVHFDTPAAVITGAISATTGSWVAGNGSQTVYGYAGGVQGFPTGGSFTGGFEAGITNDGSIIESNGFLLNGNIYSWSFDLTSTTPILGEVGGNPNFQVGFYGTGVNGFPRLSQDFQVPEASVLILFGTGLLGLVGYRRVRRMQ